MQTYQERIAPGIKKIEDALFNLDGSDNWVNDEIWNAREGIRMIENPFGTIPARRFVHITTSFCDPDGNSDKSHSHSISFDREISAALLYIELLEIVKVYNRKYFLQISIQDIEEWLNNQKALYKTTQHNEEFIEDTGLTVSDMTTEYGSIDFFIEFGIHYEKEV